LNRSQPHGGQASPLKSMMQFGLTHDSFGRLVLIDAEGVRHIDVTPVRAFPNSDPEHWISIVDSDGHEIVCLEKLADVPPATRRVLEEEFANREFVPVIERIYRVSAESEPSEWTVQTDRGQTKFVLESEEHARRLDAHRAMISDAHGTRYLIADIRQLDSRSRRYLERYL
jgi:hypothetical protein